MLGLLSPTMQVAVAAAVLSFASGAPDRHAARADEWVTNGPWGADVRAVAADPRNPGVLYAGTTRGVFKSTNGGRAWTETAPFVSPSDLVVSIAVVASVPPCVVARTYYHGLFRSVDGGESWSATATEIFDTGNWENSPLSADPNGPALYASVAQQSLLRSVDGGQSWEPVSLPVGTFGGLVVAPSDSRVIYAAHYYYPGSFNEVPDVLAISGDGGQTWSGVSQTVFNGGVASIAVDPQNPSVAFVATAGGGIRKTTDGGSTWIALPIETAGSSVRLAMDAGDPDVLYASDALGVLTTLDGGQTWARKAVDSTPANDRIFIPFLADPSVSGRIYVGQQNGFFRSEDRGLTWEPSSTGMDDVRVSSLATSGRNRDLLLASAQTTWLLLFRLTDDGSTWSQDYGAAARVCAQDPADASIVFAAGWEISKSTDAGATWTPSWAGPPNQASIAIDPGNPSYVYVGLDVQPGHMSYYGGGVLWSSDRGEHWHEPTELLLTAIQSRAVSPRDGSVLAAARTGVHRSDDHGLSWSDAGLTDLDVRSIRFAPSAPAIAYAATATGFFRSDDGGQSWSAAGLDGVSVTSLAVDRADPSTVYAATDAAVVDVTHDGGRSWQALGMRGMRASVVSALLLDANGEALRAATDRGVFSFRVRRPRALSIR